MIVDVHAHIFPHLGGAGGWKSASAHLAFQKAGLYIPRHGGTKNSESLEGADFNFRVGRFGRFEWSENGVDYYRQYNPPSLQDQVASPEFMLAQMDHAGVDIAVLQNALFYGKLNQYFSKCVKKYPDRFVGLAELNERRGHRKGEIKKLRHVVKELGLKGIYYKARVFFRDGVSQKYTDREFDLFWREISDLGISVHWALFAEREHAEGFLEKLRILRVWAEKFPDIPSIIVHGLFPIGPFMRGQDVMIPTEFFEVLKQPNVAAELLFPVIAGPLGWDYPYPQAQRIIKHLYEEVGAEKLVWGSDMPLVECNCTYRQSLTYLKNYCDFIAPKDMDLILGGNAVRILKIEAEVPNTVRSKLVGGIY
jgi:predicted TIM-barrel fold metal-dependent hydrolase